MAEPDTRPDPFVTLTPRQRWVLVALFGLYLATALIMRQFDPNPTVDWIPAYLAIYVGLAVAPLFIIRARLGWFHPLVFASILHLVDLLRRFSLYSWGVDHHIALPSSPQELSELIELQILLHSLAIVAHYAGYFLGPRLPIPMLSFPNPRRIVPRLVAICVFAAFVFAIYIVQRGGLSAHIASWALGRREQLSGTHYMIAIAGLGTPACWIWLAYGKNAVRSPLFWAAASSALTIAFLSSGSRSSVVFPALIGLMIWMLRERKISYVRVLVGILIAFYAIAVLGTYRRSGWEGEHNWDKAMSTPVVDAVTDVAGSELEDRTSTNDGGLPVFARVPHDVPLLYGDTYLAVLTLPVPRVFWADKPTLVDGRVGATFFGSRAGIPPGGVGEAYWNFHVPGVIMVFFLFGMFHRWLGTFYRRHADRPGAIVIYAVTLLVFREPASPAFVYLLIVTAPLVIMLWGIGALRLSRPKPIGSLR